MSVRPLLLLLALLAGSAGLAQERTLRWGAASDGNVPFAFHPDESDALAGFEKELIDEVARRMGRRAVHVRNVWDGLIPGLQTGSYDLAINGIEISDDRARSVDFSIPYFRGYEQIVVRRGEAGMRSLGELAGRRVGTLGQTLALELLERTPGVTAVKYAQELQAYADLAAGRLDAVLLDFPIAKYYAGPDPRLELVGGPVGEFRYGVALPKGSPLKREVDTALAGMTADGTLRRILSRWDLWGPAQAALLNQPPEPDGPPTGYLEYVARARASTPWTEKLARYFSAESLALLGRGALTTLALSACAMVLAVGLGLALATGRAFGPRPLGFVCTVYVEAVRGTPLLIQALFLYYGLPEIGLRLPPFVAGVLALGLNYAAYESENFRAGLRGVPRGQEEAALALGLSRGQALRHVVLPQALRVALPPMTNDFISLLKDSSLVSMITLLELTGAYQRLATQHYDYFLLGAVVAAFYLLLGLPFVRLARRLEAKLDRAR
ncbi:MAG: ABC transporter substrate-binding protein/permease [Verrucomicrobiota bacterium]